MPIYDYLRKDWEYYQRQGGKLSYESWLAQGQPDPPPAGEPWTPGLPGEPPTPGEPGAGEDQVAYSDYMNFGGTLSFADWVTAGKPEGPTKPPPPDSEVTDADPFAQARYQMYLANGGGLSYEDWLAAGQPANPREEPPTEDEVVTDEDEVVTDEDEVVTDEEEDFSQQLAAAVAAYQRQIEAWGASQRAEAQRLGARGLGKMSRMQQAALLAQGRTAGEIEQLTAGGMEAGARSMADLIKQINLQTQQQQAGAAQFGIGTMIGGEELGIREREMAMAGTQYQQRMAEMIRQFNLSQQQQAGQFGQLMTQRRAEQPAWWEAPLGAFAGGIGAGLGSWATGKWF